MCLCLGITFSTPSTEKRYKERQKPFAAFFTEISEIMKIIEKENSPVAKFIETELNKEEAENVTKGFLDDDAVK